MPMASESAVNHAERTVHPENIHSDSRFLHFMLVLFRNGFN